MTLSAKILATLARFFDLFRFIEHARQRREAELAAMHERNIELIDTLMSRLEKTESLRTEAAVEAAKGQQAMAEALQTWFEMFKFESQDNSPAQTVRPIDEWAAERQRATQELAAMGYPVDEPPEKQMAWLLANQI
jgi:DNA-binding protein H-NS